MLRIVCSESVAQAKNYYTSSLKHEADPARLGKYYGQEQEIIGQWHGKGAELLGLKGKIDQSSFEALCDNTHPQSGERLTARTKTNRRVGYDFNFNCPKSVSVVQALTGDERIVTVFRESVDETMRQIELEMKTRVRVKQAQEDRLTSNMVWGEFIHFTARPVEGKPDPHLHAHCFVFNATYDAVEQKWKAGQFADIKHDGEYYEAAFHARLAQKMMDLGYTAHRAGEWWEIEGVSRELLEKFSQRTEKIEAIANEEGITDSETKGRLGAKTREKKSTSLTMEELKREWSTRLSSEEKESLRHLLNRPHENQTLIPRQAMDYALAHCFERASAVDAKQLVAEALWHGMGQVTLEEIEKELHRENIFIQEWQGRHWCTTKEVLAEEWENIGYVKRGYGQCEPLFAGAYSLSDSKLGADQKQAIRHLLRSKDRVMAVRGPAGTGKSTMMKEAVFAIGKGGHQVFAFAPSAEASRGNLRASGFENAQTVAHLLHNVALHPQLRGQVIWIDEAGLLSARQMNAVFDLAQKQDCRVILSGDTRQHTSVERGDALRLLEKYAGLRPAELTEIRRQKDQAYREAVRDFANGRPMEGFQKLETMGSITEADDAERYEKLAKDYADTLSQRKTALVVSPTHVEGEQVTGYIRNELKERGRLGSDERMISRQINLQWTEAQRSYAPNYQTGMVVQFHQNVPGFVRGDRVIVASVDQHSVCVRNGLNQESVLPLHHSSRFQVYERHTLPLAPGDKIRITQNGYTLDGQHRLNNGALYELKGFTSSRDLKLANGWVVSQEYGNLAHGYCQTSHVAQSKTVDRVFVAQSAQSMGAASAEQFYVSMSRARGSVMVYTDSKEGLKEAIQSSGLRMSAHELLRLPAPLPPDPMGEFMKSSQAPSPVKEPAPESPMPVEPPSKISPSIAPDPLYEHYHPFWDWNDPPSHGQKMGL